MKQLIILMFLCCAYSMSAQVTPPGTSAKNDHENIVLQEDAQLLTEQWQAKWQLSDEQVKQILPINQAYLKTIRSTGNEDINTIKQKAEEDRSMKLKAILNENQFQAYQKIYMPEKLKME